MQFAAPTAEDVKNEPGYAFGLQQGLGGVENSAAAKGGLYSGNALKALTQYGTDYAGTKYNDAFSRAKSVYDTNLNTQTTLANAGQGSATQLGNSGANFANNVGNIGMSNANAQGAAGIAQGNAWGNLVNQGISTGNKNNWWQGSSSNNGSYDSGVGSVSAGGSPDGYWADGGPVRAEPKVGTRSPLPSGGGGGLSKSNVLQALIAQPDSDKSGVGALGTNPVTNPSGIVKLRLIQAGEYADGGEVRREPKIGSHSPLPSGGGGGLSPIAVRAALAASQPGVVTKDGIALLTANPVTNPQAILEQRLRDAGAYAWGGPVDYMGGGEVDGPGGPRDDAIDAHLSNNEHVFDERAVTAAGGGDNARGQRRLNALRAMLHKMGSQHAA